MVKPVYLRKECTVLMGRSAYIFNGLFGGARILQHDFERNSKNWLTGEPPHSYWCTTFAKWLHGVVGQFWPNGKYSFADLTQPTNESKWALIDVLSFSGIVKLSENTQTRAKLSAGYGELRCIDCRTKDDQTLQAKPGLLISQCSGRFLPEGGVRVRLRFTHSVTRWEVAFSLLSLLPIPHLYSENSVFFHFLFSLLRCKRCVTDNFQERTAFQVKVKQCLHPHGYLVYANSFWQLIVAVVVFSHPYIFFVSNGKLCCDSDLNECSAVPRLCSHFCENFFGSFRCSCPMGYALSSDNKTCEGKVFKSVYYCF